MCRRLLVRLRSHLTYANVASTLALMLAAAAVGGPALAGPVGREAASVASSLRKALNLGKRADRRSKQALKLAKEAKSSAKQGPTGATGPAGSDAQFNGASAGGGLTGSYPNPTVAPNTIGAAEVASSSLGLSEISPASGQYSIDPPNLSADTCYTESIGAAGVAIADSVIAIPPFALEPELDVTGLVAQTNDQFELRICNRSAGSVNGAARTYRFIVLR